MFASESGEWKLGGFEVLSSMKEDDAIIYVGYPGLVPPQEQGDLKYGHADYYRHTEASSPTRRDIHPQRLLRAAGM